MPNFVSSFHPDVDYNATADYHAKIEDFLARLDAKDHGAGKDLIFRVVKQERAFKGRAIFEGLCRHYPGIARGITDEAAAQKWIDEHADELVDVSALLQAFYDEGGGMTVVVNPHSDPYSDPDNDPDLRD